MAQQNYSSRMYAAYRNEVEKSGILTATLQKEIPEEDPSFKASLAKSRYRAIKEFRVCHKDIVNLFEKINAIETAMRRDLREISGKDEIYNKAWKDILEDFNLRFSKIFQYADQSLIGSFSKKLRRIDNFTICLFGRTKSGKSTTMEALTEGDGTSIGKGRQNTTQDVKEYQWRELLIIDTPGIDAMDKSNELESLALSYADESDLVVFLLPHQIEEGDFDKFKRFYKQNKPILFVLNVKKEIDEHDNYRMFLKHSGDIFEKEKIAGYKKRINDFMLSKLNIQADLIPVIPIHSASAFMAVTEGNEEIKRKLYEYSNFRTLEDQLIKEIREYGELYRIKNPHDSVILFAKKIMDEFNLFQDMLLEKKEVFEKNIKRFSDLEYKIWRKKNSILRDKIEYYLSLKKSSVSLLVSNLLDEENERERKKILSNFMPEKEIKKRVEDARKEISNIIEKEIKDFFKTFSTEMKTINLDIGKSSVFSGITSDIGDIEDLDNLAGIFGGLSAGGSIGLGILSLFEIANAWNPIGWALIAGTGIWGWIYAEERKEKKAQAKKDAKDEISLKLDEYKNNISSDISRGVTNILTELKKNHISVMKKYVEASKKHIQECNDLSSDLRKMCKNSTKRKFTEMLRCIQEDNQFKMESVKEKDGVIEIKIPIEKISNREKTEQILSRVEEKPVIIVEKKPVVIREPLGNTLLNLAKKSAKHLIERIIK